MIQWILINANKNTRVNLILTLDERDRERERLRVYFFGVSDEVEKFWGKNIIEFCVACSEFMMISVIQFFDASFFQEEICQ